jgi:hypothetical protein
MGLISYKVRLMMDTTYEVIQCVYDLDGNIAEESVYQGRLADCEAWIRLHEGGYM